MQIIREPEALRAAVKTLKEGGKSLAFVPTMGALHAGHIQLVTEAARCADAVAASIFVNPMQFGEHEDLDRYPRQEEADAALLSEAGCDLLWLPTAGQIYPDGFATRISVAGVSERWEGEARPGHFDGVATVVAKLLVAVAPHVALFGELRDDRDEAAYRPETLDAVARACETATLHRREAAILLFAPPVMGRQIRGSAPIVCAWSGDRCMQEAAARWLVR